MPLRHVKTVHCIEEWNKMDNLIDKKWLTEDGKKSRTETDL